MAEEINAQDLKEFYNKGMLAFEKKNYDYAIELFSQILSSKYDHLEARHYLHLSLKNKLGPGRQSFIVNAINAVSGFFASMSAETMLKKDNIQGALESLEKINARNPNDMRPLKKMADIFLKNGLLPHAIQNLEEAKSIDAKDINILKKLGDLYLKKEDYKTAKSNYEEALKINPNDSDVLKALKNLDALGTIQQEFGSQ